MAIQIDLETTTIGIPYPDVYFRLVDARVLYSFAPGARREVVISLAGYATAPTVEGVTPIAYRSYTASLGDVEASAGDNFIAKCYAWAMLQPDMAGGVEV